MNSIVVSTAHRTMSKRAKKDSAKRKEKRIKQNIKLWKRD